MPKDKRSCTVSNKSHGLLYKPYSRGNKSGASGGGGAKEKSGSPELEEDLTCPICMESPHNAVLLLCNSVHKGCRPFICDSSYRHSNCLDQYIKAQAKSQAQSPQAPQGSGSGLVLGSGLGSGEKDGFRGTETCKGLELMCPLCRGRVEGWKVIEKVRQQLNLRSRGCAHDSCPFTGAYEELRKHARYIHPLARPSEVDPVRQREWWRMESQRDLGDVFSTIHSAMPGATIVGDYVIEEGDEDDGHDDDEDDDDEDAFEDHAGEQPVAVDVSRDWWTMLVLFQIPAGGGSGGAANSASQSQALAQAQQHHPVSSSRSNNSSSNNNGSSRGSYSSGRRSLSSSYGGGLWGGEGGSGGASSSGGGRASLERTSHSHHHHYRGSSSQRRHRSSSRR